MGGQEDTAALAPTKHTPQTAVHDPEHVCVHVRVCTRVCSWSHLWESWEATSRWTLKAGVSMCTPNHVGPRVLTHMHPQVLSPPSLCMMGSRGVSAWVTVSVPARVHTSALCVHWRVRACPAPRMHHVALFTRAPGGACASTCNHVCSLHTRGQACIYTTNTLASAARHFRNTGSKARLPRLKSRLRNCRTAGPY